MVLRRVKLPASLFSELEIHENRFPRKILNLQATRKSASWIIITAVSNFKFPRSETSKTEEFKVSNLSLRVLKTPTVPELKQSPQIYVTFSNQLSSSEILLKLCVYFFPVAFFEQAIFTVDIFLL